MASPSSLPTRAGESCLLRTSSSAGPSRVRRPRRSSEATSNGSTASSTGTADGARIGVSREIFMSGDCEVMAFYLGSRGTEGKGRILFSIFVVPAKAGTHNQRVQLRRKASAVVPYREITRYGSLLSQGRRGFAATPPPQNTTPEYPFARQADLRLRRTPPTAGRRSPRR